jgi:chemosensory pili system protein ChpB (putative protein-glutamate methylesterase)
VIASRAIRAGLIADASLALHQIQAVLLSADHQAVISILADTLSLEQLSSTDVDVWIVELEDERNESCVELLYEHTQVPVLMGDGVPPQGDSEAFPRWQKRLRAKLAGLVSEGEINLATPSDEKVNPIIEQAQRHAQSARVIEQVWVLAASLGGPEAVKLFLDQLADNLPVAFVYAQHTNDDQDLLLAQVLARHNSLEFKLIHEDGQLLQSGVAIVPTDHQVEFRPLGKVRALIDRPWPNPFSPNISQVVSEVGRSYKEHSGVIIFSGMSDDGARGAEALKAQGGEVWVQQPDTCICSAMPDAAIAKGIVTYQGSPQALAKQLVARFSKEYVLSTSAASE